MPKKSTIETRVQTKSEFAEFEKIAKQFGEYRQALVALPSVRAIPTIFPQYDHITQIGGHPLERVAVVHGESAMGKSKFVMGLGLSFLMKNSFFHLMDPERTTSDTWISTMMGKHSAHPFFTASRPGYYEDAVDEVRVWCNKIGELRTKELVAPETTGLIVVDSLRKLVPKNLLKKMLSEGAEDVGADGMKGRGAMHKAALNAQWLDELVILLEQTKTTLVFVARETEDPEADIWSKRAGTDYKVGGGKAIIFDSSLVNRIERASYIFDNEKSMIGERHRIVIRKSKVAAMQDKQTVGYFHTSNGKQTPEGFDRARDVFELACEPKFSTVDRAGAWYTWGSHKWNGEAQALKALHEKPELLAELEAEVRSKFKSVAPTEISDDR